MKLNKWLKGIAIVVVLAVLVAFVGGAIFILTFDPSVYKDKLVKEVKTQFDRDLQIKGELKLSLFPRIGLDVNDISLSEPHSKKVFASVKNVQLAVAIWPLLSNRFLVDHMSVQDFTVNVEHKKEGGFNFDDFYHRIIDNQVVVKHHDKHSDAQEGDKKEKSGIRSSILSSDLKIDVAGLDMTGGQLNYHDSKTGQHFSLNNMTVHTGRITPEQPFDINLNAGVDGGYEGDNATLNVQGLLRYEPTASIYNAQNLSASLTGKLGKFNVDQVSLKGSFNLNGQAKSLQGEDVSLAIQAKGLERSSLANFELNASAPTLNFDSTSPSLLFKELAIQGQAKNTSDQEISWKFDSPDLAISPTQAQGKPLTGTVKIHGKEDMNLSFSFEHLSGTADQLAIEKAMIEAHYLPIKDNSLNLNLSSPAVVNLLKQEFDLPAISGEVSLIDQQKTVQKIPLIGNMQGDLLKQTIDFKTSAMVDSGKFSLTGNLNGFVRPKINFDVAADRVVLDPWISHKATMPVSSEESKDSQEASSSKMPQTSDKTEVAQQTNSQLETSKAGSQQPHGLNLKQALLSRLSGVGTFNINTLVYENLEAKNLGATLIFDTSSNIQIKSLKTQIFGGQVSANSHFDMASHSGDINAQLKGIQIEQLLTQLGLPPHIQAPVNMDFDVTSQGENTEQILKNLKGKFSVTAKDGLIKGVDLTQQLDQLSSMAQSDGHAIRYNNEQMTPFDELAVKATIDQGLAKFTKIHYVRPDLEVQGKANATLNLVDTKFYVPVQATLRQGLDLSYGKIRLKLKQVSLPLLLQGQGDDLNISLPLDEVKNKMLKKALSVSASGEQVKGE